MVKNRRVEVTWEDIAGYPGWRTGMALKDFIPAQCVSVGFLIESSKKYVKVAGTLNLTDKDMGDIMVIPRSNVKRIRFLR